MPKNSQTWDRWGIINHLGDPWTPETFDTQEQADAYLAACREGWPPPKAGEPEPLRQHRVSKMRVTVTRVISRRHKARKYEPSMQCRKCGLDVQPHRICGCFLSAEFQPYRRTQISEIRPWRDGDDMAGVSVSDVDKAAGSPKAGDMIARNPKNHADQWLIAGRYFLDNFTPI